MNELKLIVVSHMHPDHAGAAPVLRKRFGVPIAAHPYAHEWYKSFGGWLQCRADTFMAHIVARKKKQPLKKLCYNRHLKPDYLLHDEQNLPFHPDWKVYHTPGHTAHDISLHHPETGTIYVADLFLKIKDSCKLPFPVIFPEQMEKSIKKIANLQPKQLLHAHGQSCIPKKEFTDYQSLKKESEGQNSGIFRLLSPFVHLGKNPANFEN